MSNPKQSKGRRTLKAKRSPSPPPVTSVLTRHQAPSNSTRDDTPLLFLGKTNGGNQSKATPFRATTEVTDQGSSLQCNSSVHRSNAIVARSMQGVVNNPPKSQSLHWTAPFFTWKRLWYSSRPAHTSIISLHLSADSHGTTNGSTYIFTFGKNGLSSASLPENGNSTIPTTYYDY
jgi:hypothetical protein